jgi:Fic family protein
MIPYVRPTDWARYNPVAIVDALTRAKATVLALQTVPYQRRWVEALQTMELKREVAGTSRIEGAEFTEKELGRVMKKETAAEVFTRSQRQAAAALKAYEWIGAAPLDRPADKAVILALHRLIVTGADDDHCPPGELRGPGNNVTFGTPSHRGCEGGEECKSVFEDFCNALSGKLARHDPLVQAIVAHYHIAAMHPFLDGNGRTARALEAFMLRRAGLRDTSFIAMSNYYYEEKQTYLSTLALVRQQRHDLTEFLIFALSGVEQQAKRLLTEIQVEIKRELFLNLAQDLFNRLKSSRKRVIARRQMSIIRFLMREGPLAIQAFIDRLLPVYSKKLKSPMKAITRDINGLISLRAVTIVRGESRNPKFDLDLDWPAKITESEFFTRTNAMPKVSEDWLEE